MYEARISKFCTSTKDSKQFSFFYKQSLQVKQSNWKTWKPCPQSEIYTIVFYFDILTPFSENNVSKLQAIITTVVAKKICLFSVYFSTLHIHVYSIFPSHQKNHNFFTINSTFVNSKMPWHAFLLLRFLLAQELRPRNLRSSF